VSAAGSSREPRVVHTVPALFGPKGTVGGAERYALELARNMAKRVPTTLLTFGDDAREERMGDLRIQVLRRQWRVRGQEHNPFGLALVPAVAHADVIHCHQQRVVASSVAAAVGRLRRRRVFVSDLGGGGWDISAYVSTDRWYHGHLHISEYSRRIYRHQGKPWAHVIYGGVDADTFRPAPRAATSLGRRVVYVGRLMPHKGVNDLVEAVPPDMPLELIGRPYHERFVGDLHRLAEGKDVLFRHDCDEAALVAAYQQAACVVLPSVYRTMYGDQTLIPELLGQTLLEGMACGIPAICTDVASMPEVVEDGVTGFVVPPNDPLALRAKLRWLADHPDEASAMGRAGRQRVLDRFHWGRVVEHCLEIYGASTHGSAGKKTSKKK
jgi:glycosyltransferase involved in cell wall biosynthesis